MPRAETSLDVEAFARGLLSTLNLAGAWALQVSGSLEGGVKDTAVEVESSPIHQAVSGADLLIQEMVLREIRRTWPEVVRFGEERTIHNTGRGEAGDFPRWFVALDPLDGTHAFLQGARDFATMLALSDGERLRLGMVHLPSLGETLVGIPGVGLLEARSPAAEPGNPWREEVEAVPFVPPPLEPSCALRWGVHYRFLREPYVPMAAKLAARGIRFVTLLGGDPDPALGTVEELGSNGSLVREMLRGRLAGFLGPYMAFHDIAPLFALVASAGVSRFFTVDENGSIPWRALREGAVMEAFYRGTAQRNGAILARDEEALDSMVAALA
jgi:hypothetical protein